MEYIICVYTLRVDKFSQVCESFDFIEAMYPKKRTLPKLSFMNDIFSHITKQMDLFNSYIILFFC